MRRHLLLILAALVLPACAAEEESVANRFDRIDAEIRNKANEIRAETENEVRAVESEMQNQIDALDFQANLSADVNLTTANTVR